MNSTFHKAQKAMQKHAIFIAANEGINLDYDVKSMANVDAVLVRIAAEVKDNGLITYIQIANNESVNGIAECFGSYIAECAERKLGKGLWMNNDPKTNEQTYALKLANGNTIFPMEWVYKKIFDPINYSIDDTYRLYTIID
ncbi:hypothetical protein IPG36_05260 [bacterium]|nr:MAG: hypothetical protein IPG36_05260 [bacterium]